MSSRHNISTISLMMLMLNLMLTLLRALVDLKYSLGDGFKAPEVLVIVSTFIPVFFMISWACNYDMSSERAGCYGAPTAMIKNYEDLKRTRKAFVKS